MAYLEMIPAAHPVPGVTGNRVSSSNKWTVQFIRVSIYFFAESLAGFLYLYLSDHKNS